MSDPLARYDFAYPPELVALTPAKPRDTARLLVYDRETKKMREDVFRNLASHLPPRSVVVFNRTKVIPARLWARKDTGGKVQVFYIRHDSTRVWALSEAGLKAGMRLTVAPRLTLTVVGKKGSIYELRASFPAARMMAVLERFGTTPIPPYMKRTPLSEQRLRQEYQTVFARIAGSVAAPTASLHFTPRLLKNLAQVGHDVRYITLHVGLGTFAPITTEQFAAGRLHAEHYEMDAATQKFLNTAKQKGRPIIAVGTTVARTLESAADVRGHLKKRTGETTLFIREKYHWRFVEGLVTNFHVPRSSLLVLVSALIGRTRALELYRRAISRKFRLFSFGDGMFLR